MRRTAEGSILYSITDEERQRALRVGRERQEFHDRRGTPNAYGMKGDRAYSLRVNQLGALGELVVATLLGCEDEWVECTADYQELPGDVWPRVQVRSGQRPNGRLYLHPRDSDDHAFVLNRLHMAAKEGVVEVVGWTWAGAAKREEWWGVPGRDRDPRRACFMVPTEVLTPGLRGLWAGARHNPR